MSVAVHLDAAWSEAGLDSRAQCGDEFRSIPRNDARRPQWAAREKMQPLPPQCREGAVARSWSSCKPAQRSWTGTAASSLCSAGEFRSNTFLACDAGQAQPAQRQRGWRNTTTRCKAEARSSGGPELV